MKQLQIVDLPSLNLYTHHSADLLSKLMSWHKMVEGALQAFPAKKPSFRLVQSARTVYDIRIYTRSVTHYLIDSVYVLTTCILNLKKLILIISSYTFLKAWKRRKNYNPMRSATASVSMQNKSSAAAPSKTQQKQQQHHQLHQSSQKITDSVSHKKELVKINNNSAPESAPSNSQLHKRSASFHYPDGSSRVTHSVYSSEEDFNDEEEDDEGNKTFCLLSS